MRLMLSYGDTVWQFEGDAADAGKTLRSLASAAMTESVQRLREGEPRVARILADFAVSCMFSADSEGREADAHVDAVRFVFDRVWQHEGQRSVCVKCDEQIVRADGVWVLDGPDPSAACPITADEAAWGEHEPVLTSAERLRDHGMST